MVWAISLQLVFPKARLGSIASNASAIFINFEYCGGREAILAVEYFPGEICPPHLEIPGLYAPCKLPPPEVLIGFNESLFLLIESIHELIYLVLGEIILLVHFRLKQILEPQFQLSRLREIEPGVAED